MRKTLSRLSIVLVLFLAACSQPKFDGSSEAAFEKSSEKVLEGLTDQEQEQIGLAMITLAMEYNSAEKLRSELDGLTAQEVISKSEKLGLGVGDIQSTLLEEGLEAMGDSSGSNDSSAQKEITNNLYQLASRADQYFLEEGKSTVKTSVLTSGGDYGGELRVIAGEKYPDTISISDEELVATLPDGGVIKVEY